MSIIRKEQLSNPLSASYALTASYAENAGGGSSNTGSLLTTASVDSNTITFTKGDGSTFPITIDTGSFDISSLVSTSSFNAFTASINDFTSSINTFTASYSTGSFTGSFTGSLDGTSSYYQETDPIFVAKSASLATTGSNIFIGNQTITGSIYLGSGSIISESGSTLILTPPTALPGQSLVLRPTQTWSLTSDHPSGFTPGDSIIITFIPNIGGAYTFTASYAFTDCTEVQLGRPLIGSLDYVLEESKSLAWTIPSISDITSFTFTVENVAFPLSPNPFITLTRTGSTNNEPSHLHLISGNPTTVDLFLGDDDQYIKIEKNAGNVVIGTNLDTNQWIFDTSGSLTVPAGGITGSLYGTASWAENSSQSISSSYALTASYIEGAISVDTGSLLITASSTLNTITFTKGDGSTFPVTVDTGSGGIDTGSFVTTSSFNAFTSSYNTGSFTGSFTGSLFGTASYALNGGVTQLLAGPNILLSPTNGLGQVTISSTGGSSSFNTATGSYGSFYSTVTQTNVAGTARSMSLNITDITNGVSVSGSTNPFNTYIKTENAGVYDIQFSAQVDKTDSGTDEIWIWLRKNGTNLTDTATSIQLVGNGAHYVAAWNFFVNAAANDYFQLMWYSPDANVRLHAEPAFGVVPGIPSLIVTVNRVDQFLSNTGSFSGSFTGTFSGSLFGTSSWAQNSITASYVQTAQTASYVLQAVSASFSTTASYALSSGTGGGGFTTQGLSIYAIKSDFPIFIGDGKAYATIPSASNNLNLTDAQATTFASSSVGSIQVQLSRGRQSSPSSSHTYVDMLSTVITIDVNEYDSINGTTQRVINTSNDDVLTGDLIRVDVDASGSNALGLIVRLTFG